MAKRATAASFTHWRIQDPEPTVTEPEFTETSDDDAIAEAADYARMPGKELALAGV
ncbi:hypothetical protein [Nocardia sp. CDC160]|uniref:hypothetical protein n=1 Tax=Nocardia sp. CDC160 TaxID=3112166 RepID=UPI002DB5F51F|nr:hypothetical protein [Nocardia sp. CDC160]MEC3913075.1 hypothetical protein [Nocardia sp. CDC160]